MILNIICIRQTQSLSSVAMPGQVFVDTDSASSVFLEVELFLLGKIKASRASPRWRMPKLP